jgi:iron-sulfur cluster repair protein YtfE (RIC family)
VKFNTAICCSGNSTLSEEISALKTRNAKELNLNLNDLVVEQLSANVIQSPKQFLIHKTQIAAMSLTVTHCYSLTL